MKKRLIISAIFFSLACTVSSAYAATYYVRPDGGTAQQCTGLADAAYSGSGTNQNCAFNHINWALAPQGGNPTKMVGGDTVIIDGSNGAKYMMGYGSPNTTDTALCYSAWPYSCILRPIPSGPDAAHPTRILGKGWDAGCKAPPQLWGTQRLGHIINLQGSDNVEVQCLELTDHSDCIEFGPDPAHRCNRDSYPYGEWAGAGIEANDSENVLIKNVNIHGLRAGVHAGRLKDWTIEDTVIANNSFVGWDGDIGANNSSNSGNIIFRRSKILYSGCGETYPGKQPYSCYSQDQGGYGDALGTHKTGGNWVFDNVDISHNVSDGLDLLYHDGNGSITIQRSRFEGNAGNQVKVSASTTIDNSVIIGNCGYFSGQSFTWKPSGGPAFNNCRAGGNSVGFNYPKAGITYQITNSTITSEGDVLVLTGGGSCNGNEKVVSRNNIFVGGPEFLNGGDDTVDLFYSAGIGGNGDGPCGTVSFDNDYSIVWNTKRGTSACAGSANLMCQDPKLAEPPVTYYKGAAFNANLQSSSPAINKAQIISGKSNLDYNSFLRGSQWDIGALEYGSTPTGGTPPVTPPPLPPPPVGPVCGNSALEGSEQCDDGNSTNGDGCSSACVREVPVSVTGSDVIENFATSKTFTDGMEFGTCNALTAETIGGARLMIVNNSYLQASSTAKGDGFIIRSTNPLPSTYKLTVDMGDIDFDLTDIADEENGVYLPTITTVPGRPTTNDWWHLNRKVHIDVDNNMWGSGGVHPVFIGYYNPSTTSADDPADGQLVFNKDTNSWIPINSNWASAFNYQKNTWYTFEIEKTSSTYFFRIFNAFSHALLKEASIPVSSVRSGSDFLAIGDPHVNYYKGSIKIKNLRISNISCSSGPSVPPTINSFDANPTSITSGGSSTLSWSVAGATSLSIGGVGTVTGTSVIVNPTATTTYTLTATNSKGSVTDTATVTVTSPAPTPSPTGNVYKASADFSGTQGGRNWSYRDSLGKSLTYNSANEEWKGDETYLLIWDNGMHPGVNKDVIRRWTAPSAGTAVITGVVGGGIGSGACGDGTNVSIKKNTTVLWQKAVVDGAALSNISISQFTLAQGDTLDFIVNKGGTDYCDSTDFDPIITFTPSTGTPAPTPTPPPAPVCGNKVMEGTEQCDDGNLTNGDGCNSACQKEVIGSTSGKIYYVRKDGGTGTQCNGLFDAPYPGSGSNQNCAMNHPFWVLPPKGKTTLLKGGDTLIIDGSNKAEYMIGLTAPNTDNITDVCYPHWPYSCTMQTIPSGPDAKNPTRILGKGWDTGCTAPPQLWGTERVSMIINLVGSKNVEVQCLEVTDHSDCQEFGPKGCKRDLPDAGPWGQSGIVATDSENVLLKNLNIHGMALRGVYAGRLKNWTIEDTKIISNSFVGWDGDVGANNSSNSGTMKFVRTQIKFSGCGETYPGGKPYNCYSQDQGGYGDGLGTHQTGADWMFIDSDISHNVSDGLDLLYHDGSGTITIERSRFEGNAGNQVKTAANVKIGNSVVISNCGYFKNNPITWQTNGFNNCRAAGSAFSFAFHPGNQVYMYNTTVIGNGDTLVMSSGSGCTGSEKVISRNNVYLGSTEFNDGNDLSDAYYAAGAGGNSDGACGSLPFDDDYSIFWNTKYLSTDCTNHSKCVDPKFEESPVEYYKGDAYNVNLRSDSPARGAAINLPDGSKLDYYGESRQGTWDAGAIQFNSSK